MRPDMRFGARLRYHRERAGKTRAVLGGLVGRSEEWVKAVETDRLLTPRLPMLLRLADVLGITALAVAAWYYAHVYRCSAQLDAAEDVLANAANLLDSSAGGEQLARWGQLQLGLALTHAKAGRAGQAWHHLDLAGDTADRYGGTHPWLLFGRPAVDAYAVTIDTDLFRLGEATRRVERYDPATLPSRTRRALYFIDAARAHSLRKDNLATVHLLGNALRESTETVRYNTFARATALELVEHGGAVRTEARQLAAAIGLAS